MTKDDQNTAPVDQVEDVQPAHANHRRDAAAELLGKSGTSPEHRIIVSPADSDRILRRIDLYILPLMLGVYFLQGIDKSTLAYASVFGLIEDTNLVGDQFSWLGSIVYLAQLVMQFPLAWLLVKLPIGKFTGCMVACWGITLSTMAAAHNFGGLMAARAFLGAFEASVPPAFVAITQMWWRRREQTLRISYWYAMNGFTNMFGSLITYGLGHISSPLKEYQARAHDDPAYRVVANQLTCSRSFSCSSAKFLNDEDKVMAVERLRMNQQGVMSREWRWDHLWECLRDPKTWIWFTLIFSISVPSGGISTFGPLIIKSFGFDSFQTILFNIPFGAVQLVATIGGSWIATRIHKKGPVIAALCLPPIAGCIMLMVLPTTASQRAARLAGYYLISVYPGISPLIYSWSAANTAGDTKRKCTSAALFVGQSVGNVVGPLLYKPAEAPRYSRGLRSNLALYCVIIVLVGLASAYLAWLNRSHSRRRVAMGKSAVIVDTSLFSAAEAEKMRRAGRPPPAGADGHEMAEAGEDAAAAQENVGSRAFENLTDLENEEFVFVF
ncbi:putative transporter [Colletotrichum orbiculare MAFF 240422]|uniref:Transporter n=1 Tax=Colletotrichum orbiculare (strain 104-T / ATCC 96160 / CBS 514.97 / LARS 414 / MAFF 240422) TaxID=1213857 RepID=A0A484FGV2_COLOR|nr:putative transporter [Colletotrichum orbiculare MAFF 240422]